MSISKASDKRSAVLNWIQAEFTIIDSNDNETNGIDVSKNSDSRACSASTVKGIVQFIFDRGYTLSKNDKVFTKDSIIALANSHFDSLFVKTSIHPKPLPTSFNASIDFDLDTDECKHFATLGPVGKALRDVFGEPHNTFDHDDDIEDADKWGLEWKLLINGSTVSVYQLDDFKASKDFELAVKGPITPEIRLFCLQYATNPYLIHDLRKWKDSRSKLSPQPTPSSPPHSLLSLESIDLDDL